MIKMMVIAKRTPEQIAEEFGTTADKIEAFEKLYFDLRPHLHCGGLLRGICFPAGGPSDPSVVESRWLASALCRGWPGVEEVALGRVPKGGARTLERIESVALSRAEDYFIELEASGTPPSEKDVELLLKLARIQRLGLLPLSAKKPSKEQEASPEIAKIESVKEQMASPEKAEADDDLKDLSPLDREKLATYLQIVFNKVQERTKEWARSKIEANKPKEDDNLPKSPPIK
jgi:hypothetical protein